MHPASRSGTRARSRPRPRPKPRVEILHDHHRLTFLLEELTVVFQRLVDSSVDEAEAMVDIRDFMTLFQSELARHMHEEETDYFPLLAAQTDDKTLLDTILDQHRQIEGAVDALTLMLDEVDDEESLDFLQRGQLLNRATTLLLLFSVHDRTERRFFAAADVTW